MTLLTNNAEGGSSGTAVSTGNSGGASGSPFDIVTIGSGANCLYDSAQFAHGGVSIRQFSGSTSAAASPGWSTSMGTVGQTWLRMYMRFQGTPPVNIRIAQISSGSSTGVFLRLTPGGNLVLVNMNGSAVLATSTIQIPALQWFRLEMMVNPSTTAGQAELRIFLTPDAVTPDEVDTSAANLNLGASVNQCLLGLAAASASQPGFWIDDLIWSTLGYPGPVIQGTAAIAAKKAQLAGAGTYTPPAISGTAAIHSKKIALAGAGSYAAPITGTAAIAAKKAKLAGVGAYSPPGSITGTAAIAAKKAKLAGAGTYSPPPPPITGTAAIVAKKIALSATGGPFEPPQPPAEQLAAAPPDMITIYWGDLSLNDGDRDDGLCTVITDVDGWYGSPPLAGNDLDRALSDGAVLGFKTAQARVVTVSGAATGPRDLLNGYARQLAALAVSRSPDDLIILEDDDSDEPGSLMASVRADSDSLSIAWTGRNYFTWQVALTAADPRLYEAEWRTATLSALPSGASTGRPYPFLPPRFYASADVPNTVRLVNPGSAPAPVWIGYTGQLSSTRLSDGDDSISLASLGGGQQILVASETLTATAPGGASRASYVMAGSVPMLIPAYGEVAWSLYGTGAGNVVLSWRGAWA